MSLSPSRAALFASIALGLAACVPTTNTQPVVSVVQPEPVAIEAPPELPPNQNYAALVDGKFNLPAIQTSKVPAEYLRQVVDFPSNEAPGTVIINPKSKHLYFILGDNKAIRYGVSVGKAGFEWSGEALVTGRRNWPTWTPPKEMIERNPKLEKWAKGQPGGLDNPMGARALYLTTNGVDYGYRIHGTPDWWSIGKSASSGCIRMINQDVIDLFNRVPSNAKVIVMTASGEMPSGLKLPPPSKKAKSATKPAAKPAAAPEAVVPATTPAATAPQEPATGGIVVPKSVDAPLGTPAALSTPAITAPAATAPAAPVETAPVAPVTTTPAAPVVSTPVLPAPAAPAPVVTTPAAPAAATTTPPLFAPAQQSDLVKP